MPILTIELTDEQAQALAQEAERLHLSTQELAVQTLDDRLAGRKRYVTEAIGRIIAENAELYRRLA